jgi:ATP-dependent DNA helicase Q1
LKIAQYVHRIGGKATVNMLAGLAKNAGGGAFDVPSGSGKGKRKEKEKVNIDLEAVAGGAVDLPRDVSIISPTPP